MIPLHGPQKPLGVSPNRKPDFVQSRKVLNLCGDSKQKAAVIFRATPKIKIINWSCLAEAGANF
jgi:hypothetical protein